jgi:hypothetical protein
MPRLVEFYMRCKLHLDDWISARLKLSEINEGFAAMKAGKTVRSVIEISNRSTAPSRYLMRTADWDFSADFSVNFRDDLQPGSCRPWVAIERPEVVVPGAATLRYRFEVSVPADASSSVEADDTVEPGGLAGQAPPAHDRHRVAQLVKPSL